MNDEATPTRDILSMHTTRSAVGTAISADFQHVVAVCLRVRGHGLAMDTEVVASATRDLSQKTASCITSLSSNAPIRPSEIASLTAELSSLEAEVIRKVFAAALQVPGERLPDPLVVGRGLPSIWFLVDGAPQAEIDLSDAARLAEFCGFNIVDAFSARDLAKGGRGGPIGPMAEWLLLHDIKRNRVLLDLGPTVRMTYLPSGCEPSVASDIIATDIAPGSSLLDAVAEKRTGGQHTRDPRGHLAVKGRCALPLFERLLAAPYFDAPPPRWHPAGAPIDWFLEESLSWGKTGTEEACNVLCTLTHFIAEAVARCLARYVPPSPTPVQLLFCGEGEQNGLLMREIGRRLPPFERVCIPERIKSRVSLDAACAAVLAMLHVDQTPQTLPRITGIHTPRVLGRLTPGSPRNWQRLVQEMAAAAPATMSLRCAM